MPPTLVLDLDGTLVDSVPDLTAALNRIGHARGLSGFDRSEVAAMVGDGVRMLVTRALAARGRDFSEAALTEFSADYEQNAAVLTQAFPGAVETLGKFADVGWRLAICTNKPARATHALLEQLGLDGWFAAIGAGDSYPTRKPHPGHLLATLSAAGGTIDSAVMVGDHANDVLAANAAGLPCIFAGWGYGSRVMAEGAAAIARQFSDLPALADTLLRKAPPP